jgi:predicted O-methyltransferase YrrM
MTTTASSRLPRPVRHARRRMALFTRVQSAAARRGLHVARQRDWRLSPNNYYSALPDLDRLGDAVWARESAMVGVPFDAEAQIAFAEEHLAAHVAELDAPHTTPDPLDFHLDNAHFESVDAEIAYAMVRHLRPRRVVELGSGFSTQVLAAAAHRNAAEGVPTELYAYNPYPSERMVALLERGIPGLAGHVAIEAQALPLDVFLELAAGDVLFIDTSHTVKLGGEVVHLFLEVLPRLAPGVVVHVHDIALPYEYDRRYVVDLQMPWAEQYLLQALLCGSLEWEVLFGAQAAVRKHRARLEAIVPSLRDRHYPSSFWMRRDAG